MFRYACGLPQREYLEWIEDRSTVTDINMFDNPLVDRILCEPRVCLPVSALAVWMLLQAPAYGIMLFVEQVLFGAVAALTLVLADVAGERLKVPQMPTSVHFLLFGAAHKFKHTAWRVNVTLGILLAVVCIACGHPFASLVVLGIQYTKSKS